MPKTFDDKMALFRRLAIDRLQAKTGEPREAVAARFDKAASEVKAERDATREALIKRIPANE